MENLFALSAADLLERTFECACGAEHRSGAHFVNGPFAEEIQKLSAALAPACKAVVVSSRDFFLKRGEEILKAVRAADTEPINVIANRRFDNALENIGGLFSLPDDVRMILVCEPDLYCAAAYFSALRNIPLVYGAFTPAADGVLAPIVQLKIKNKPERIYASNERYIVADSDILATAGKETVAEAYASLASGIVSLIDYRVRGALTGKFCRTSYNLVRSAISDALNTPLDENAALRLLENRIRIAAAEAYTDGAVSSGAENAVAELLESSGKTRLSAAERKFAAAVLLIDLYAVYFAEPHDGLTFVPDYAERAEALSAYTGYSEGEILGDMLASAEILREEKLAPYAAQLKEEIDILQGWMKKIAATYIAAGGREIFGNYTFAELKRAVYRAPDLPHGISVLTLMRECGALELLNDGDL